MKLLLRAFAFFLCLLPVVGYCQTAEVGGTVLDPSGAAIAQASVEFRNQDTGVRRQATSNKEGVYRIVGIDPGKYDATVQAAGFKTLTRENVLFEVGDKAQIDFRMQVGQADQEVEVDGSGIEINTTDGSVSTVVDREFVENLPMNGRTFEGLVELAPGVTQNIGGGVSGNRSQGQFTVDGQRASSNYWTVDGVSANIGISTGITTGTGTAGALQGYNVLGGTNSLVSVDALEEFRIETSTYTAEFGRTPGAQVSILTRSGTNDFHGNLFDYFRNTVLDAEDWFADEKGLKKAEERQNDFGGVLGAPILKNKTFFFFSYEGLRLRLPQTFVGTVPDLAARQNTIASVQPFINAYPTPAIGAQDVAGSPGLAPYNTTYSNPSTVDATSLRLDQNVSSRLSLFARFNYSPSSNSSRGSYAANDVSVNQTLTGTATLGATATVTPNVVNEARYNFSYSGAKSYFYMDTFGGGSSPPVNSVLPAGFTNATGTMLMDAVFGTNMAYDLGPNSRNVQRQYNVVDTLTWQRGRHSAKFGVDYRRLTPSIIPENYVLIPVMTSLAQFETGTPAETVTYNWIGGKFLFQNLSLFAQDAWRISSRLNLTYGLRWDVDYTPRTTIGPSIPAVTGFSLTDLSNLALAPAGTSIYKTRYSNFAPRLGVGYTLSQDANWGTVARGGFGVYYDLASSEVGDGTVSYYPFLGINTFVNIPFPTPAADAVQPPILVPNATQGTIHAFDPDLNVPYTLQWSTAIEQGLGKSQSLSVSYVASSGRRLIASETVSKPNAHYQTAMLDANAGNSNFESLQVQFKRKMSKGLQALASYTWAHSIDTGSYSAYANGNFANINANRGSSDFDVRHVLSAAVAYDVPAYKQNLITRTITGGWSTENILQLRSAPPVDIVDGAFTALTTQNASVNIRPDLVAGQPVYLHSGIYPGKKALNPAAFATPPTVNGIPIRQGTLGRNYIRAFNLDQWDFALHRDFPIFREWKLQFRSEMFNVINHPNFAPYNSTFGTGDSYFGQSTTMYNNALGSGGNGSLNPMYQNGGPRSV